MEGGEGDEIRHNLREVRVEIACEEGGGLDALIDAKHGVCGRERVRLVCETCV